MAPDWTCFLLWTERPMFHNDLILKSCAITTYLSEMSGALPVIHKCAKIQEKHRNIQQTIHQIETKCSWKLSNGGIYTEVSYIIGILISVYKNNLQTWERLPPTFTNSVLHRNKFVLFHGFDRMTRNLLKILQTTEVSLHLLHASRTPRCRITRCKNKTKIRCMNENCRHKTGEPLESHG